MNLEDYGEAVALLRSQEALKICFWPNGRVS